MTTIANKVHHWKIESNMHHTERNCVTHTTHTALNSVKKKTNSNRDHAEKTAIAIKQANAI